MRFFKFLLAGIGVCMSFLSLGGMIYAFSVPTPHTLGLSFPDEFANPLLKDSKAGEHFFDLGLDLKSGLRENMKKIFYPSTDGDLQLRTIIKNITIGILLALLVRAGIYFLLFAPGDEAELKLAWKSLIHIIYGAALIFLVTWVLGTMLKLGGDEGAINGVFGQDGLLSAFENLMLFLLGFLKGFAFFLAIIFLMWYGYRMMQSFGDEEKLKKAKSGMLNVFLALIFIKIIDYLYMVAQMKEFKSAAISFIVQASKFLGYIGGIIFVMAIVYAGYQFVASGGDEERIKHAKTTLKTVFITILVILLFMLIIYQIFNDIIQ